VDVKLEPALQRHASDILEEAVTGTFKDVPLADVIAELSAHFVGNDDYAQTQVRAYAGASGVFVTIAGIGQQRLVTRIYPLTDLCPNEESVEELIEILTESSAPGFYWKAKTPDGVLGVTFAGTIMTVKDDNDVLVMLQYAGSIKYVAGLHSLLVRAHPAAHAEILGMLRLLREAKGVIDTQ
jgi:hypothetical protein